MHPQVSVEIIIKIYLSFRGGKKYIKKLQYRRKHFSDGINNLNLTRMQINVTSISNKSM